MDKDLKIELINEFPWAHHLLGLKGAPLSPKDSPALQGVTDRAADLGGLEGLGLPALAAVGLQHLEQPALGVAPAASLCFRGGLNQLEPELLPRPLSRCGRALPKPARGQDRFERSEGGGSALLRNRLNQALPVGLNSGLLMDGFDRLQGFAG